MFRPHQNGTVPALLGDRARTRLVDELCELVGLDPSACADTLVSLSAGSAAALPTCWGAGR